MTGYLLDTSICIFLLRGKYDVDKKIDSVGLENCAISEITAAELKYGATLGKKMNIQSRNQNLDEFLNNIKILPMYDAIDLYAEEKSRLRLNGTPSDDDFDLLIGCTSIVNNLTLVTDNTDDFKRIKDIKMENWIIR
ncbi:MAG: PIN domain-containing protein [Treponema sp.]|nr:PIN domain-containing protein [Treponema sp.]